LTTIDVNLKLIDGGLTLINDKITLKVNILYTYTREIVR